MGVALRANGTDWQREVATRSNVDMADKLKCIQGGRGGHRRVLRLTEAALLECAATVPAVVM